MPPTVPPSTRTTEASGLAETLRARVGGEVRFDNSARALYATDGSNYRQVPIGVVIPRDADDVLAAISTCREFGAPLLCRGGGTSLAGQCCNVAVVLDFTKYMGNILEIDPERRIARVQPGVVLDHLRNAAEKHHLTFGPDPASHDRCTIGGMIGNNSCGVHSVMAGKTDDNIEALDVVTYDGTRLNVGQTPRRRPAGASIRSTNHVGTAALGCPAARKYRAAAPAARSDLLRPENHRRRLRRSHPQKFPNIPRRVSGYNLNHLLPENGFNIARALVGSEGTCATALEATCRLVESPPQRVLLVVAYPDIYQCADPVPEILAAQAHRPRRLRRSSRLLRAHERDQFRRPRSSSRRWRMADGRVRRRFARGRNASAAHDRRAPSRRRSAEYPVCSPARNAKRIWEIREASLGATSHVPGEPLNWEGWEDAAVAPEKLGQYLRDLRKMMADFGYKGSLYGHFGHACVHTRLNFDLQSKEGIAKFRKFVEEAADLVVSYGGSLSGEHGDGQARAELLPKMFGPELMEAFRKFKSAWDPDWKMNPGKLIGLPGSRLQARRKSSPRPELRALAARRRTSSFPTITAASRTPRCAASESANAAAKEGGVMCPSWRVTHEEEHSTRGRAHLLWEMTQNPPRRRHHPRSLAQRRSEALARPLPRLQRMQERLPRRRRRRHLQSRISFALL